MYESPCNDICTTDPDSGLCVGCGRTQSEISNWINYSDEQKKIVLRELKSRNNIDSKGSFVLNNTTMNSLINAAKKQLFPISLILILFLSRLIPHPLNFTPVLAVGIFAGFYFKQFFLSAFIVITSMFLGDIYFGFHNTMLFTYVSLMVAVSFGLFIKKIKFTEILFTGL